jgi:3-hydroxy-9,10-secoandrosta-1,3,5(10)-triene-9,17-dione monooxygenase reductase component
MSDASTDSRPGRAVAPDEFRRVLGHMPTGVAVVTARGAQEPLALAVNSMTSVSLDPPLVLFCPAKTSTSWPRIREVGRFCINVMGAGHEALIRALAAKDPDRFARADITERHSGPAFGDALAWLDCEIWAEHEAGDHEIIVAQVDAVEVAGDEALEPLVFFRGAYGSFQLP